MEEKDIARTSSPFAVLDLGSNSFHLIIARNVEACIQVLHKDKQVVAMAAGLDENNVLRKETIDRALDVLKNYAVILDEFHPARVRIVATHTIRTAVNRAEFITRAEDLVDFPIEVISGNEEARLIYQGVAHNCQLLKTSLIIDIGGGSTEFALGKSFELYEKASITAGHISSTDRFFADGSITRQAFQHCCAETAQLLQDDVERFREVGWEVVIGTSSAVRSIKQYAEHHQLLQNEELSLAVLDKIQQQMITLGHYEKLTGLDTSRARVLAASVAIITAICQRFKIDKMSFEPYALRDGVLHEMINSSESDDICSRTVHSLIKRYHIDTSQSKRVRKTAKFLFKQVKSEFSRQKSARYWPLLSWAIQLHEIGLSINRTRLQKHSGYIIKNSDLPGFDTEQQELLACLVGCWKKSFSLSSLPELTHYRPGDVLLLIIVLRISCLLNIRRIDSEIPEELQLRVKKCAEKNTQKNTEYELYCSASWFEENPILRGYLQKECQTLQKEKITLCLKEYPDPPQNAAK